MDQSFICQDKKLTDHVCQLKLYSKSIGALNSLVDIVNPVENEYDTDPDNSHMFIDDKAKIKLVNVKRLRTSYQDQKNTTELINKLEHIKKVNNDIEDMLLKLVINLLLNESCPISTFSNLKYITMNNTYCIDEKGRSLSYVIEDTKPMKIEANSIQTVIEHKSLFLNELGDLSYGMLQKLIGSILDKYILKKIKLKQQHPSVIRILLLDIMSAFMDIRPEKDQSIKSLVICIHRERTTSNIYGIVSRILQCFPCEPTTIDTACHIASNRKPIFYKLEEWVTGKHVDEIVAAIVSSLREIERISFDLNSAIITKSANKVNYYSSAFDEDLAACLTSCITSFNPNNNKGI